MASDIKTKNKVTLFDDDDDDNQSNGEDNFNIALEKKQFQGKKGQMLMELQQSYRDDQRFILDKKFKGDIDVKKISKNVKSMTTLFDKTKETFTSNPEIITQEEISSEKNKNLSILSQVISNTEFLTHNKKYSGHNPKNILIKRYDPKLNLGRQLEITDKKESDAKIDFENEKNVIKLEKGVDKSKPSPNEKESRSLPQSKKSKEYEIKNMFNKLNDEIETKVEIKYDSWKQILKKPEDVGFGLFGETVTENKMKNSKKEKKKKIHSDILNVEENKITETEFVEEKVKEMDISEKKMLKSKRKKEKRKLKEKEKKEKAKVNDKIRDEKIEIKLKNNLLKEFDQKKVEDYVRFVNLVRNKKINH